MHAMRSPSLSWLLAIGLTISLVSRTTSGQFVLKDSWKGHEFLEGWNWETFDDPTHGRVNYVTRDSALALNLTYSTALPWAIAHKRLSFRIISFRVILHHASFHLPGSLAQGPRPGLCSHLKQGCIRRLARGAGPEAHAHRLRDVARILVY
jgi:hypothetical protein